LAHPCVQWPHTAHRRFRSCEQLRVEGDGCDPTIRQLDPEEFVEVGGRLRFGVHASGLASCLPSRPHHLSR
jgi:hypothetical protein